MPVAVQAAPDATLPATPTLFVRQPEIHINIGILASLVGGLVILYLKDIKSFMVDLTNKFDRHDERIAKIEDTIANRKADCMAEFASKEEHVRSEGINRKEFKEITVTLSRLDGKLDIVNRLPEISAEIAAKTTERIIKEFKNG